MDAKYENPVKVDCEKQWTHLPDTDMVASTIEDFCNDFVLALKQPNENILGERIKKGIGELKIFQFEDATHLVDHLFCYVVDWVINSKNFKPLGKQDINELFEELNRQVCRGMIMGINSEYCKRLQKYDIGFKQNVPTIDAVVNFLQSDSQWFPIVASHSSLLTAIQVEAAIRKNGKYVPKDSLMYLSLNIELREEVCSAYELSNSNNLLVLVDNDYVRKDKKHEFYDKIAILMNNKMKKFILILKDNSEYDELITTFSNYWIHENEFYDDITTYVNFDDNSKRALKAKSVIFQGKNMDFNYMNVSDEIDDNIITYIPFDVLIHSSEDNPIKLGKEVEKPKNFCKHYSERMLYHPVEIENNILKIFEENGDDIFAVEGYNAESLCQEGVEENWISIDIKSASSKIYILNPVNVHNEIEHLRQNHSCNVRWIKKENEKLYEVKSYDETSMIENAMNDKFVIFADIAGMGKSTLLYHTSQKIKESWKNLWIVKIDLNKYTAKLKETQNGEEMTAFQYMVEKDVYGNNAADYENNIFNRMMQNGNALIMFDGFDEINPDYGELIIKMLHKIKETYSCKIWITTRTKFRHTLEQQFNKHAYFFETFSEPKQIEFLINYWNSEFSQLKHLSAEIPDVHIQSQLKKYATEIVKTFKTLIILQWNNFLGVPLQLKMIADICAQQHEEWSNVFVFIKSDEYNEPSLPNLTLFDLYEKFLNEKVYLHLEKRKILNFSAIDADEIAQDFQQKQFYFHSIFGLKRLLNTESTTKIFDRLTTPEINEQLNQWQKNHREGRNNVGIIDYFGDDDHAHFAHLTYAEYFAASYLAENMATNSALVLEAIESIIPNVSPIFQVCLSNFVKKDPKMLEYLKLLLEDAQFTKNKYFTLIIEILLDMHHRFENFVKKGVLVPENTSFATDAQNHFYLYLLLNHQNKVLNVNTDEYSQLYFTWMEEKYNYFQMKLDEDKKLRLVDDIIFHQNIFFHLQNLGDTTSVIEMNSKLHNDSLPFTGIYNNNHDLLDRERVYGYNILNIEKEYGLEVIFLRNRCLQMLGYIIYSNKTIIQNFLPSIENQINGNEEEFYNIQNLKVKNEYIFKHGKASIFMVLNKGSFVLCFPQNIILLGLKVASMLNETNKCKNMSDFRSIAELLMIMNAHQSNELSEMLSMDTIAFTKLMNRITKELENIEIYQKNGDFVFLNNITGVHHWLKHSSNSFKNLENYYRRMKKFFSLCKENNIISEKPSPDALSIVQIYYNDKYMGVLIISKETGQKRVATFFKVKPYFKYSKLTPKNISSYLLFTDTEIPKTTENLELDQRISVYNNNFKKILNCIKRWPKIKGNVWKILFILSFPESKDRSNSLIEIQDLIKICSTKIQQKEIIFYYPNALTEEAILQAANFNLGGVTFLKEEYKEMQANEWKQFIETTMFESTGVSDNFDRLVLRNRSRNNTV